MKSTVWEKIPLRWSYTKKTCSFLSSSETVHSNISKNSLRRINYRNAIAFENKIASISKYALALSYRILEMKKDDRKRSSCHLKLVKKYEAKNIHKFTDWKYRYETKRFMISTFLCDIWILCFFLCSWYSISSTSLLSVLMCQKHIHREGFLNGTKAFCEYFKFGMYLDVCKCYLSININFIQSLTEKTIAKSHGFVCVLWFLARWYLLVLSCLLLVLCALSLLLLLLLL